ncbi:MAG: hypothetical protein K0R57_5912 [Paenibacillaceae bacterium]|jgi:hypothetical protein|nr:hypothetical protein [Paenibacillaceae bacterium]
MREKHGAAFHESEPRLQEAMRQYHSQLDIPDGQAAWELMKQRLDDRKRVFRPWRQRLKLAATAAGIMIFLHLFFGALNPVQAISKYFLEVYYGPSATSVSFGNYDMKDPQGMLTAPPPEEDRHGRVVRPEEVVPHSFVPAEEAASYGQPDRLEFATVEEAAPLVDFPVMVPPHLPDGTVLQTALLFLGEKEEKSGEIILNYHNKAAGYSFQLTQRLLAEQYGSAMTISDPDAVVKEVSINGHKGVILVSGGNFVHLQWMTSSMSFVLSGLISEKEAMKVARSIN